MRAFEMSSDMQRGKAVSVTAYLLKALEISIEVESPKLSGEKSDMFWLKSSNESRKVSQKAKGLAVCVSDKSI